MSVRRRLGPHKADSSQHSAIAVCSQAQHRGRWAARMQQSQTITNVIAAALSKGKKVLFVSKKLRRGVVRAIEQRPTWGISASNCTRTRRKEEVARGHQGANQAHVRAALRSSGPAGPCVGKGEHLARYAG